MMMRSCRTCRCLVNVGVTIPFEKDDDTGDASREPKYSSESSEGGEEEDGDENGGAPKTATLPKIQLQTTPLGNRAEPDINGTGASRGRW
jgi:hypothetical protein